MQNCSSKKKRPRDVNLLAHQIVAEATSEEQPNGKDSEKNPHAVALGRLGGLKGGRVRAAKLSKEKRAEIAKKAAQARWSKKSTYRASLSDAQSNKGSGL